MSPYTSYILETSLTLLGVCAIAAAALFGARRMGIRRGSGALKLVDHLPLEGRRAIYLVKIGKSTVIVVGSSEAGLTRLAELPEDALSTSDQERAPHTVSFRDTLARRRRSIDSSESDSASPAFSESKPSESKEVA